MNLFSFFSIIDYRDGNFPSPPLSPLVLLLLVAFASCLETYSAFVCLALCLVLYFRLLLTSLFDCLSFHDTVCIYT